MALSVLRRLSVRAKLVVMIGVSAASLILFGIFFLAAIKEVKVSGPIYAAIAREMDLRSDISPGTRCMALPNRSGEWQASSRISPGPAQSKRRQSKV